MTQREVEMLIISEFKLDIRILKLKMKGYSCDEIVNKLPRFKVKLNYVVKSLKRMNITKKDFPNPRRLLGREGKILKMNEAGIKSGVIADKLNVSKQRIYQILKKNGISRNKQIKKKNTDIKEQIIEDINLGKSMPEIKENLNIRNVLYYYPEITEIRKKQQLERNEEITTQFLSGIIAKDITNKTIPEALIKPTKIKSVGGVYKINTKAGVRRYPQIGNKLNGETFEDRDILKFIEDKKDNHNYSFRKIADELNELGHKTLTGREFKSQNTFVKYRAYKKLKRNNYGK